MSGGPVHVFSLRALPWVLFALSLSLNVFFVGGHFYNRSTVTPQAGGPIGSQAGRTAPKPPAARTRISIERLGLDVAQRGDFKAFRTDVLKQGNRFRLRSRKHVERLWAELEKKRPSKKVIDRSLRRIYDRGYTFQRRAAAKAVAFMAKLDANQKARFLELAKSRGFLAAGLLRDRPKERN